jgi:hypothetical protein
LTRSSGSCGPPHRKKVDARAAELLAEEMTLRQLRTAHHKTQVELASALGIGTRQVSDRARKEARV